MKPYYQERGITIYHADCRELFGMLTADVLVTDPPFGIDYETGQAVKLAASIAGDKDTSVRDEVLAWWNGKPALVFGSWRAPRPKDTRMLLIWDTKGALGMGDLSLPWKPAHQEIYVLGRGFAGHRGSDVLCYPPVQAMATNGRTHPNEKPVDLMRELLLKCPAGVVLDTFMGTGATLRAAKDLGRQAIGVELEERYCEVAARRMAQSVFDFGVPTLSQKQQ